MHIQISILSPLLKGFKPKLIDIESKCETPVKLFSFQFQFLSFLVYHQSNKKRPTQLKLPHQTSRSNSWWFPKLSALGVRVLYLWRSIGKYGNMEIPNCSVKNEYFMFQCYVDWLYVSILALRKSSFKELARIFHEYI